MHNAIHIAQQNLFDIGHYANLALNELEPGSGELPQWMNNKISIVRTNMKDVGHFVRFQADEGKSFAGDFDPGYMARKNLREIAQYADAVLTATKKIGEPLPAWADHKLSGAAELMDCVGHSLVNEVAEGRRYGFVWESVDNPTALSPVIPSSKKKKKSQGKSSPGRIGRGMRIGVERIEVIKGSPARMIDPDFDLDNDAAETYGLRRGRRRFSQTAATGPVGYQTTTTSKEPVMIRRQPPSKAPRGISPALPQPMASLEPVTRYRQPSKAPGNRGIFTGDIIHTGTGGRSRPSESGFKKFGVPGIPYPQPGWAGEAGVATPGTPESPGYRFGVPGIPYPEPGWAGEGGVAAVGTPSFPGYRFAGRFKRRRRRVSSRRKKRPMPHGTPSVPKRARKFTKARPTYKKAKAQPVYTKKSAIPPQPLVCNWWSNQHIVEPYRGVSQHSFNLRPYGSVGLEDYVSIPGQKKNENVLLSRIWDAMNRCKSALQHAPQYFDYATRNDIAHRLKSAQQYLDQIGSIYTEWANKKYYILGIDEDYEPYSKKEKHGPIINGATLWPLDETLADNFYLHNLYSTRGDIKDMYTKLHPQADDWVQLWHTHGGSDYNQRTGVPAFLEHFEDWPGHLLGTAAAGRLSAIKSIRNAYKMAAHEARCAEVLTARAVSYARNKAAFTSSQR